MKQKRKQKNHTTRAATRPKKTSTGPEVLPFIDHAQELRRRLYYIAGSVVLWGGAIYAVQQHVVNALLRPAKGQHFIYTSPGGGIDFLFRICVYGGIVLSLPVIIYNSLRFIEPMVSRSSRRFVLIGSVAATLLALAGVVFGYYVGLPAALHFLLHQFTTVQIQPLVTIQSYLGFVIVYMFGSALLFQLPLLLLFINRIKPLKPKRLLRYERWVILVAFVLAGLMNPTPNIVSQLLIAGPFIIAYQVAIVMIAIINRPKRSAPVRRLLEQDEATRAWRQQALSAQLPLLDDAAPVRQTARKAAPNLSLDMTTSQSVRPIRSSADSRQVARQLTYSTRPRPRQFIDFSPRPTRQLAPKLDRLGSV